jgi:hypothetical protein
MLRDDSRLYVRMMSFVPCNALLILFARSNVQLLPVREAMPACYQEDCPTKRSRWYLQQSKVQWRYTRRARRLLVARALVIETSTESTASRRRPELARVGVSVSVTGPADYATAFCRERDATSIPRRRGVGAPPAGNTRYRDKPAVSLHLASGREKTGPASWRTGRESDQSTPNASGYNRTLPVASEHNPMH